jgi:hypothetical protein
MSRFMRLVVLLIALTLVGLAPAASTAGVQPGGDRVIANMAMAVEGTTDIIGRGKADIRQPTSYTDPPGYFSFDAVNGTKFRSIVERVYFWPWSDEQGNRANWAFVWAYECPFHVGGPPTCTDVAWAFVDYADPSLTDFQITCWWDDGMRPPGETWQEICDAPNAHKDWTQVVAGSLVVLMSE